MRVLPKYNSMKAAGASPRDIYNAAKSDGVDEIAVIRLLRELFGLSLAQVKQVIVDDELSKKQSVVPGAVVYWECPTNEGLYAMQGRVKRIVGDVAELEIHKKFRISDNGLQEVPVSDNGMDSLRVAYLERSLTERLESLLTFVNDLHHINEHARGEKKAV